FNTKPTGAVTVGRRISSIAIDPTNIQRAALVFDSFWWINPKYRTSHVFLTIDGGTTWADVSGTDGSGPVGNLPDMPFWSVVFDITGSTASKPPAIVVAGDAGDDDGGRLAGGAAGDVEHHGPERHVGEIADRSAAVGAADVGPGGAAIDGKEDMARAVLGIDPPETIEHQSGALDVGGVNGDAADAAADRDCAGGLGVECAGVPGGAAVAGEVHGAVFASRPDDAGRSGGSGEAANVVGRGENGGEVLAGVRALVERLYLADVDDTLAGVCSGLVECNGAGRASIGEADADFS